MVKKYERRLKADEIDFEKFKKAIQESGFSQRELSEIIGKHRDYLYVSFSKKLIGEKTFGLLCKVIRHKPGEFYITQEKEIIQQSLPIQEAPEQEIKVDSTVANYLRVMTLCLQKLAYEWTGEEVV